MSYLKPRHCVYILLTAVLTVLIYPRGRLVKKETLMQKAANPAGSLGKPLLCPPSLVTETTASDFNWAFHIQLSVTLIRYAILYKEIVSHWPFLSSAPLKCGWIMATLSSTSVIYIHNPILNNYIKQWHKCYLLLHTDPPRAFSNTLAYPRRVSL